MPRYRILAMLVRSTSATLSRKRSPAALQKLDRPTLRAPSRSHPRTRPWHGHCRGPVLRGTLGILLVYFTLGGLYTVATPEFFHIDESSNVGYARALAGAELPTMDTLIPADDFPLLQSRVNHDLDLGRDHFAQIWTAKHPPLFYSIMALPVSAANQFDSPSSGLWAAKGVNILVGGLLIVATIALARALAPSRPHLALISGAWVALLPLMITEPTGVYNDFLAAATGVGTLASATAVALNGRTLPRVLLVAPGQALQR